MFWFKLFLYLILRNSFHMLKNGGHVNSNCELYNQIMLTYSLIEEKVIEMKTILVDDPDNLIRM